MQLQRVLLVIWGISCCGLITAGPNNAPNSASASARISATILPKVKVVAADTVAVAQASTLASTPYSNTFCMSSNGVTEYAIESLDAGLSLDELADDNALCKNSTGYGLQVPPGYATDYGDQLTLMVSAE